jgi:hypothetical protein
MLPRPPRPGYDQSFAPDGPGDRARPNGPNGPAGPSGPSGPDAPGRYPGANGPGGPSGPGGQGGQGGYAQRGAPGGYAGPDGFGDPARPGGARRRITDGFARLGAFTPGAGFVAARRSRKATDWDEDPGFHPEENDNPSSFEAAGRPARGPASSSPNKNRNTALLAGAGVLSAVAIAGVILVPKMLGPADPGCKTYSGPALTAYNKTINDLNGQASQSLLSADMSATVSQLTQAIADAHGPAVKSALNALLSELKTVQADVAAGTVPTSTVNALNAASTTADNAC